MQNCIYYMCDSNWKIVWITFERGFSEALIRDYWLEYILEKHPYYQLKGHTLHHREI